MKITSIIIEYRDDETVERYIITYEIKKDDDYVTGRLTFKSNDIDLSTIDELVKSRTKELNN